METKQKKVSSASRAGFTYPEILCECGEPLPIHRNKNTDWSCKKCKKHISYRKDLADRQRNYYNAHERDRLRRKRTKQSLQKVEELNQQQKHISDFFVEDLDEKPKVFISDPDEREIEDAFALEFNPPVEPIPLCEKCGFESGSTNCNVVCVDFPEDDEEEEIDWEAKWKNWEHITKECLSRNTEAIHFNSEHYWNIIHSFGDFFTQDYQGPDPHIFITGTFGTLWVQVMLSAPNYSWMKKSNMTAKKFYAIMMRKESPIKEESMDSDDYYDTQNISVNLRIDCYLGVMKKFKVQYPDAHFEVITRTKKHILSPSDPLLKKVKQGLINFTDYTKVFLEEMKSPEAIGELKRLREIAKSKVLFLVCFEKNSEECHRSLVKKLIQEMKD